MNKVTLFIIIFCVLPLHTTLTKPTLNVIPAKENSKKVIIFDLGDVVFKSSKAKQAYPLISTILAHPSIIFTMMTFDIRYELFALLSNILPDGSDAQVMYNQGHKLPQIWIDWMIGKQTARYIETEALSYLTKTDMDTNKKRVLRKVVQTVFNPKKLTAAQKPIKPIVKLIKQLKENGYKLYVLSNWDKESFPLMLQKHDKVFKLFNGIMISGEAGIGKPNPHFYTTLLQKYHLDPHECIFIDDEPKNVETAQNLGITAILNKSIIETYEELYKLGVLSLS